MASQDNPTSNLFTTSNILWLLIIAGAIIFGFQLFGKKNTTTTAKTATTKNSTTKSVSKNDASNKSFLQVPLGLYTPMQKSNDPYFMEGMELYKKKKYNDARNTWLELPRNSTVGPDTLNYFLGGTYFAEQDYQKAILYFQRAVTRPGSKFGLEGNWYLAVSNNEMKNSHAALEYLKKVDEHPLKDQLLHHLQGVIGK